MGDREASRRGIAKLAATSYIVVNTLMNHTQRIEKALLSLEGLSIGDSFGQNFFIEQDKAIQSINSRILPTKPWFYTLVA